jgi:hypothetical protein
MCNSCLLTEIGLIICSYVKESKATPLTRSAISLVVDRTIEIRYYATRLRHGQCYMLICVSVFRRALTDTRLVQGSSMTLSADKMIICFTFITIYDNNLGL